MISALACVPRGAARPQPRTVSEADPAERDQLRQDIGEDATGDMFQDEDSEESGEDAEVQHAREVAASMNNNSNNAMPSVEEAFQQLDMDNYDNEPDDVVSRLLQGHRVDYQGRDEYLQQAGLTEADVAPEDVEAEQVRESDLLVVAAKAEEEAASLEVWLFEDADAEGERNAYVHHDIPLPAFPLAVTWMKFNPSDPGTAGSFAAVSTMEPGIEIWDLDRLDVLEPCMTLGGEKLSDRSQQPVLEDEGKRKRKLRKGSHKRSVLCLTWNPSVQNVLASGSADKTIKLWDLAKGECETTLSYHTDKVQSLAWNPQEASVLLSGAFGGAVCICDTRGGESAVATWGVSSDVECVTWGHSATPTKFAVSRDDGHILCFDTRVGHSAPLFTLAAHAEATTGVAWSPSCQDLIFTASVDQTVKAWNIAGDKPKLVKSQNIGVGAVLCLSVPQDVPQVVVAGGAKGEVAAWDTALSPDIAQLYPS